MGSQGSTEQRTTAAAQLAAGRWTVDGGAVRRRHGRRTVQRAAARARTQDGGQARCTRGCTEEEETEEVKRKQRQRFWLQRLHGEARQTLGGERPYLCSLSHLPATHSHVLLHAQAPCGYHWLSSTPELHMALNSPSNLCPWPHPANRYLALHHPRPLVPYPLYHPHHPYPPAASAGCPHPCPGRDPAGPLVHGLSLGWA